MVIYADHWHRSVLQTRFDFSELSCLWRPLARLIDHLACLIKFVIHFVHWAFAKLWVTLLLSITIIFDMAEHVSLWVISRMFFLHRRTSGDRLHNWELYMEYGLSLSLKLHYITTTDVCVNPKPTSHHGRLLAPTETATLLLSCNCLGNTQQVKQRLGCKLLEKLTA